MATINTPEIRETREAILFQPAISIVMPFEPKMTSKRDLVHALRLATEKIEQELTDNYADEMAILMMKKLEVIIGNLNYSTHKRSIAIYANPVFEKVLYLDMPVEERISVGESFGIRDLIYCKKQINKYLILLLGSKESRMYLADSNAFVKIISDSRPAVDRHIHEVPESLINFYDISEQKKIIINKFLHHIDNTLSLVLDAYHLPLFILGTEGIVDQFKSLTKHSGAVVEYVYGSYEEAGIEQLKEILEPYTNNWKKVCQKNLLNQLREAAVNRKLAVGMSDVWHEAMKGNGRLLIVEKNFIYGAEDESIDDIIFKAVKQYDRFSYIKNALDDVIEKVLESGGDVEFVDKEVVKDYHHIVMVQFY